jgi:coenzyme F420-0:L-glutamate ligase/coenzyme F420-1:gamma-L-glutamate ligase
MVNPMAVASRAELLALGGIPIVRPRDDLAAIIADALAARGDRLRSGDVVVVAQKIVSKAEDRFVTLASVTPSPRAIEIARETAKDPRLVEVILSESKRVVRLRRDLVIVEHRLGIVLANAGVDHSNVGGEDAERVLLLPRDPDSSAAELRGALTARYMCDIAVIVNDSVGRAWRRGTVGIALGAAGLPSLLDLRGKPDLFGRRLRSSIIGFADELAASASLIMGQASEGRPVVIVRGLDFPREDRPARSLIRAEAEDLFR